MKKLEDPKKFFDLLEKSIIEVIDNQGFVINKDKLKIVEYKNKYSNLSFPSPTLFDGEKPLKTSLFKIKYECLCGNISTIHLKKFLSKNTLICPKCRETEEKRERHSKLLGDPNFKKKSRIGKIIDINQLIDISFKEFYSEPSEFIEKYFNKNITISEFENIKDRIVEVNGINIQGVDYRFVPFLKVGNQSKYSQYLIIDKQKTLLSNIQYRCEICESHFNTTRRIKEKIKNHTIMCQSCSFCNKTFKIRKHETIFGDIISYQSKLEKKFIQKCEGLGIKILNGDTVEYLYEGKLRKYRIDFLLPEYKILIELKGNHIWHRKQLETGKWRIKQLSAENYSQSNGLIYKLLFQENIDDFFESIKI
jgi:predicted SprT family Zn-dependent metalloprotease